MKGELCKSEMNTQISAMKTLNFGWIKMDIKALKVQPQRMTLALGQGLIQTPPPPAPVEEEPP